MSGIKSTLRNTFCQALAMGVIATGRARQGKRRALAGEVITPIYFHNPNKRLFIRCIRWLKENGFTFISATDLIEFLHRGKPVPKGAVWLSCDDAYKEWVDVMLPVIREAKVPITMFIPSGIVEGDGRVPWVQFGGEERRRKGGRDVMTISELAVAARIPEVTIGAHTVSHAVTVNLPEDKARYELGHSSRTLESWTGAAVRCFAYPEGLFDGREKPLLADFGYSLAATTQAAFITRGTDPYFVPRFCVPDNVSFPEAICNMVGVWRPVMDPIIDFLNRRRGRSPAS